MILIGYSGHGFVACSIALAMQKKLYGYCDREEKIYNPFKLQYLGTEATAAAGYFAGNDFFISVGDNTIRQKIYSSLSLKGFYPVNLIHPSAIICGSADIANCAVMIAPNVVINPLAKIGTGVICNTATVIEHECVLGDFSHIGPGAILCGNVTVGTQTFVGAGSVVRQGITIGNNVMIGAGAVVVKDVPDNAVVVGNPARSR